ncbi:DUF6638 family protein [Paracoccus seriniphilus]|uniref:Uncharacterized protein n=1 Tax=Paracoccus seriniphilus TaxID=184748 RepID=A0A239Q2M9_9RHOB|nr:DUF6638 family protein [Paracoccus seriniphilus]WCR14534.1 hypothetical protein JHW44_03505 [Paracoccus seriniphilus]SNT76568.1 hypothetical protein SAMN05444959_12210 [Paracoccus seriniphilus]
MRRLIEKGLMFGNLIRVDSPAWLGLYNRALARLTGRETALGEFHIDISGFSPEVGDELGDMDYLSPRGGERQFILLTTEQKTAPLLNSELSVLRDVLRRFITENESQLFSLTARDAVIGQIDDRVWSLETPADLATLRHLSIEADTTGNHVAEAERLGEMIDRFRSRPDAWWDDVLIARMIEQARKSGDVLRNPVRLAHTQFAMPDFWTADFGGVYVIRSCQQPAMIFAEAKQQVEVSGFLTLSLDDRHQVAAWLARNALAEPIINANGADAAAILRQKIDFILADAAIGLGIETGSGSRSELRRAAARMGPDLPDEISGLSALHRYAESGGDWPVIDSGDPAYFYALRATSGPLRDLINRLLSELAPRDVRQLFITHKPLFYKLYQGWPDSQRDYVVGILAREYAMDKQGTREALFGAEPDMSETGSAPARSGPWGPARVKLAEAALVRPAGPWGRASGGND